MTNFVQRAALGQKANIGEFYDGRRDAFLNENLLATGVPIQAVDSTEMYQTALKSTCTESYPQKLNCLRITPALAASIFAGLVTHKGASRYLSEQRQSRTRHGALYHTYTTVRDRLNLGYEGLRQAVAGTNPPADATHVVIGMECGAQSVVSVRDDSGAEIAGNGETSKFPTEFQEFEAHVNAHMPGVNTTSSATFTSSANDSLELTVYSDILSDDSGMLLSDYQDAVQFFELIPLQTKERNRGRGNPIQYELLPIEFVSYCLGFGKSNVSRFTAPADDCLTAFVKLFDEYEACRRDLEDYGLDLAANKQYLRSGLADLAADQQRRCVDTVNKLKMELRHVVQAVREGTAEPSELWALLRSYSSGNYSPAILGQVGATDRHLIDFIEEVKAAGATYIGHNGLRLDDVLRRHQNHEAFVFSFTPALMQDQHEWQEHRKLLAEILRTRDPSTLVAVVDCEASSIPLDKLRIRQYPPGEEAIDDVLEHRRFMSTRSFASCPEATIESQDVQKPIQRRHVTIPCPGVKCSVTKVREWLCPRCTAPVEFGFSDQFIYCDCGRSLYSNYQFKCNNDSHGTQFTSHNPDQLLKLLRNLQQSNYLNILILGETGVGKSTFINAMINYLEFDTLDEALAAERLNYVIPCSFQTQVMDRTNPDRPIEEKRIQVGSREDEFDGSGGDSATQQTTVYPVTFSEGDSTYTVRLIDTPGIGDTRGVDLDRKNMADILSTLSGYDELHGILILLKSNAARLTITFSYCVKELLTHLHHNAAQNMAYGFTNTRISNYTPGDTYGPLKNLMGQHPDVQLALSTHTMYCFDSESFRYLAAAKQGVNMPNKQEFDRSWEHSRNETRRLIDHYKKTPAHRVKNTISLHGARQLITELTKPIADISQIIQTNIALCEDKVQELKDTRLKGDQLRNQIKVQKVQLTPVPLGHPRTVCSNSNCTTVKDDGLGQNNKVIVYDTHCHARCYLDDVKCDVVPHPGLIHCAAFGGSDRCNHCSHHWQEHLHILYELHEETVTLDDTSIQQQLLQHQDDITVRQQGIAKNEHMIEEYKQEREIIRNAAAKFGVFLQKFSMAPYNDALIAYLDFLIKEEQQKVQAGGSDKKLKSLNEERLKHKEAIDVLTRTFNSGASWNDLSEGGVDRIVSQLYGLPHFGKMLQNLKQGITEAHQSTYRERPHTVRGGKQPRKLHKQSQSLVRTDVHIQPGSAHNHATNRGVVQVRTASGTTLLGPGVVRYSDAAARDYQKMFQKASRFIGFS